MPKVSVIIPVYGVEKYIERCACSLFEQTLDDIEYLFIDDCTLDNSIGVLESVIDRYPHRRSQIVIHRMNKNSGQAKVREWGMRNATGDFIMHCDSDDWVDKNMYQQMYNKAIQDCADCVICDYAVSDGINVIRIIKGGDNIDKYDFIRKMLARNKSWSLCNKLFKRNLINKIIYPKGDMGEDMVITFQCILNANSIGYLPYSFYYYYKNPYSITRTSNEEKKMNNFYQNKANLNLLIEIFKQNGLYQKYQTEFVVPKYELKSKLYNTTFNKSKYILWRSTYPEINGKVLLSPYICLKDKIIYILTFLRLFPYYINK